jgi:hypothetical protein
MGVSGCSSGDDDGAPLDGSGGATSGGGAMRGDAGSGGHASAMGGGGAGTGSGGAGSGGTGSGGAAAGSGGAGIDPASPTARTAACIEYVRGFCRQLLHCNSASDVEGCVWTSAQQCPDQLFQDGSTRMLEGTVECGNAWAELSCADREADKYPACATPGTLPAGAKCVTGFSCASRVCAGYTPGTTVTCGTCTALVGLGEPCDAMRSCPDGSNCVDAICVKAEPRAAGDAGVPVPPGGFHEGDVCDRGSGGCGMEFDCRAEGDSDVQHCVPYPTLGQDCSVALWCKFGDSYCDISNKCLAFPAERAACGVDRWTGVASWCADDLSCDSTVDPPVCRALPKTGDACTGGCATSSLCMADPPGSTTMTCVRRRFEGESCTDASDRCLPGATRCEGGVCVLVEWQGLYDKACMP